MTKLLPIKEDKVLIPEHFPNAFYAAVFRLWETVPAHRIAGGLGVKLDDVYKAANDMCLPLQQYDPAWEKRGYITTIRNAWHILPYEQLLGVLGWDENRLASVLKEDDFLSVKLGDFKPHCERVKPEKLTKEGKRKLEIIKTAMGTHFSDMFCGKKPFDFFEDVAECDAAQSGSGLRMIYSYCGLYAGVLDNDIDLSYPDSLLSMYRSFGINAIWLPAVLYQLVPFTFDESYSQGWQDKQMRLRELIAKAGKYNIKVYLYLNEPRCMPNSFFDKYPHLAGRRTDQYTALCSECKEVMSYLRYAVRTLCEAVPDIGGFFAITCSENLTHCKSNREGEPCERCADVPISKLISDIICAISEESSMVNPNIKTIAWSWAWDIFMTRKEITECIDSIPTDVIIQCNSEANMEYTRGGIRGNIIDYSMSIPGPGPDARFIWDYAKSKGHEVSAKVQVNVTWECSALPFLPVFDLIREHMRGLKRTGVNHLMLSWTLGGYPSFNLKLASACLENPSEETYDSLLKEEFGEYDTVVKKAAKVFSLAFSEFPFDVWTLYKGPQNPGPSNLLYSSPSGFEATMTCYCYDDIDSWRSIYPRDIYIEQLRKLSVKWKQGLDILCDMPDCLFKQCAEGGYMMFRSSYLQALYTDNRDNGVTEHNGEILHEEKELAINMYKLMLKNNFIGYEAANHYYFNKTMLAEKFINCEYLQSKFALGEDKK